MDNKEGNSRKYEKQIMFKYSDYTTFFEKCVVHFKGDFRIDYELEFDDCKVVFDGKITCSKNIKFKNCEVIFGEIPKPTGFFAYPSLPTDPDISHQRYIIQEFDEKISVEFIDCDIYQEDFQSINKRAIRDNIGPIIELYDGDIILVNCDIKNVVDLIDARESSLIYIDRCIFQKCKGVIIDHSLSEPNGEIIIKDSLFKEIKFVERYKNPLFWGDKKEKLIYLNGYYNMISNCKFENGSEALISTSNDGYTLIEECDFSSSVCVDEAGVYPIVYTYGDTDIIDCEFKDSSKDIIKEEGELDITNLTLVQ